MKGALVRLLRGLGVWLLWLLRVAVWLVLYIGLAVASIWYGSKWGVLPEALFAVGTYIIAMVVPTLVKRAFRDIPDVDDRTAMAACHFTMFVVSCFALCVWAAVIIVMAFGEAPPPGTSWVYVRAVAVIGVAGLVVPVAAVAYAVANSTRFVDMQAYRDDVEVWWIWPGTIKARVTYGRILAAGLLIGVPFFRKLAGV